MDNINSSNLVIQQQNQDDYKTMRKILKRTPEFRRENDLKQLLNFMSEIQYFKQFEENGENIVLKKCCQYMQLEEFKQGETVFQINSVGEKFYVIFTGEVEVLIPVVPGNFDKLMQITTLQQGKGFGELALINNTPRMAEIRCLQETQLLVIDKKTFNRSIRIRDQQKINQQLYYIKQLPFMQNARANVQKQVYSRCLQLETNPGYYLFKEGDPSDNIYIIKEGEYGLYKRIELSTDFPLSQQCLRDEEIKNFNKFQKHDKAKNMKLKTLTCGMYFGEEDLYFNQNRTFTVRCEKIGSLAVIPKLLFQEFIFKDQYSQKYFKDTVPIKVKDLQEQVNRIRQNVMKLDNAKYLIEDRNYLLMNRSFQQECKIRQEKLKKGQKEKEKQANIQSQYNLEQNLENSGKQIQKTKISNTNDQEIKNQSNQNYPAQANYNQKNRKISNGSDNSRNKKKEQKEKNIIINKIIDKDLDILKKKKNTKWFVKTREQSAAQLEAKDPKAKFFRKKKEIIWGNLADLINKQYADYDDIEENQQEDNQSGIQNINQRISNKQDNIFKQEIDPEFKDNQFVFINQVFKDDKYKVNQDVNKQLKLYDINIKKEIQIFEAQQNPYKNYLKIDEKLNNKSQNQINQTIQKITQANKTMNELNQNQMSLTLNNQEDSNLLQITRLEPSLLSNRSLSQCKNYVESKFSQKRLTDFSSIQAKNAAFFNQDPYFSIQKVESEVQYQDFPELKNQIISKDTNSQSQQHLRIPPKFPSTGQIDGQKKAAFSQGILKFQDSQHEEMQDQVHFENRGKSQKQFSSNNNLSTRNYIRPNSSIYQIKEKQEDVQNQEQNIIIQENSLQNILDLKKIQQSQKIDQNSIKNNISFSQEQRDEKIKQQSPKPLSIKGEEQYLNQELLELQKQKFPKNLKIEKSQFTIRQNNVQKLKSYQQNYNKSQQEKNMKENFSLKSLDKEPILNVTQNLSQQLQSFKNQKKNITSRCQTALNNRVNVQNNQNLGNYYQKSMYQQNNQLKGNKDNKTQCKSNSQIPYYFSYQQNLSQDNQNNKNNKKNNNNKNDIYAKNGKNTYNLVQKSSSLDELDTDILNQNSMTRCKTQQSTNNRQQLELNFDTQQNQNQNQTNSVQNLDYKSGFNINNKNMQISAFTGRKTILRPTTSLNKISKSQISEFQNQVQQSEYYINENIRKEIINNNYLVDNQINNYTNNIKTWSNLLESKNQVSKNQFTVKTLENIDLYEFNENVKSSRELNNQILNNNNKNIKQKQQLKQKIFTGLLSCDKKNKNYKQSRQLLIHSAKGKNPKVPIFSKENQQRDKYLGKEKIKRNQLMLRKMQENQVLNINNAYIQN